MERGKPILCVDFDGVIHGYQSGWQGAHVCVDPPVPGAIDFLRRASAFFSVHIYSSRSHQEGGFNAMQRYIEHHVLQVCPEDYQWIYKLHWPTMKPSAKVTIDDRAITFTGSWPRIEDLLDFEPWNKQGGVNKTRLIPNVDAPRYLDLERRYFRVLDTLLWVQGLVDNTVPFEVVSPREVVETIDLVVNEALVKHPVRVVVKDGRKVLQELGAQPAIDPQPAATG